MVGVFGISVWENQSKLLEIGEERRMSLILRERD